MRCWQAQDFMGDFCLFLCLTYLLPTWPSTDEHHLWLTPSNQHHSPHFGFFCKSSLVSASVKQLLIPFHLQAASAVIRVPLKQLLPQEMTQHMRPPEQPTVSGASPVHQQTYSYHCPVKAGGCTQPTRGHFWSNWLC